MFTETFQHCSRARSERAGVRGRGPLRSARLPRRPRPRLRPDGRQRLQVLRAARGHPLRKGGAHAQTKTIQGRTASWELGNFVQSAIISQRMKTVSRVKQNGNVQYYVFLHNTYFYMHFIFYMYFFIFPIFTVSKHVGFVLGLRVRGHAARAARHEPDAALGAGHGQHGGHRRRRRSHQLHRLPRDQVRKR